MVRTNSFYVRSPQAFYEKVKITNPEKTYFTVPWRLAGKWFKENTPQEVVVASSAKDLSTFVGERKLLEINSGIPLPLFESFLRDNAVEYVLSTGLWSDVTSYEFFMKESPRFWFEPVFSASNQHVFKVHSRWILSAQPRRHFDFDTVSAAGLLRKGRLYIVGEDYPGAVQALKKASALEPNQPESVFQIFLAYTLMGDSLNAVQQVQSMFTKPRSTPYVWSAQIHLSAMNRYREAKLLKSEVQQSNELFALSKLYWNLGYQRRAYRLIRETIGIDPTFFSGLLWAWHYGIQAGDTVRAATYLQTLESIDRTNAVVKSFRAMTQFSDTLRRTKRPEERARLRLAIAREYDKMDLPEEAIDEAERGIGEYPSGRNSRNFLGEMFQKKEKLRAAARALDSASYPPEQQ
ncbi:MAG: hypothetical protein AAB330_03860, partial [Bacteroidota bacterium]